jgi:predicted nucleic acid-binding protein
LPVWRTIEPDIELPRNIALLDTNVLVAFCDPDETTHEHTKAALDMGEYRWAVTRSALVEASSFLSGKRKKPHLSNYLLEWVMTPGEVICVGETTASIDSARSYAIRFHVDFVDAALLDLANRITVHLDLRPAVHVATYDTRDFLRFYGQDDLSFHVYDMRDLSSTNDIL